MDQLVSAEQTAIPAQKQVNHRVEAEQSALGRLVAPDTAAQLLVLELREPLDLAVILVLQETEQHPVETVGLARLGAHQSSRRTLLVQGWAVGQAARLCATSSVPAVVEQAVVAYSNAMLSNLTADAVPTAVACSNAMLSVLTVVEVPTAVACSNAMLSVLTVVEVPTAVAGSNTMLPVLTADAVQTVVAGSNTMLPVLTADAVPTAVSCSNRKMMVPTVARFAATEC